MENFSKTTYSEKVCTLIKARIRSRKLKLGESISEASIAEECGISRAPVREALHILEEEGFLMSHPKRGKCVAILTPEHIRDSYELSALLEAGAAVKAAGGIPDSIRKKLDELLEALKTSSLDEVNIDEHASLGSAFHEAILSLSGNEMLHSYASRFSRVISKYLLYQEWRSIYSPLEQYERHKKIYDALLTAEPERIRQAIYQHYSESSERLARFCPSTTASCKKKVHFPEE